MKRYWLMLFSLAVLVGATVYAIEERRIDRIRRDLTSESLRHDWAAAHFTFRLNEQGPEWFFDAQQPAERVFVAQLRQIFAVSDQDGRLLQSSRAFQKLGLPTPSASSTEEPRIWEAKSGRGRYLLCTGPWSDPNGRTYQVTLGRMLD